MITIKDKNYKPKNQLKRTGKYTSLIKPFELRYRNADF